MSNEMEKTGRILIYQNEKGDTKIDVFFDGDTIWMPQRTMAELYQVDVRTINEHIMNIFADGELIEERTIRNFRIVQQEGARKISRDIKHYNRSTDRIHEKGLCLERRTTEKPFSVWSRLFRRTFRADSGYTSQRKTPLSESKGYFCTVC